MTTATRSAGHPDEEVFLYDAAQGRLSCVSCNSTGATGWSRPHGVFDTELAGEGVGLLVDRPEIWSERWLAGSIPGWGSTRGAKSQPAALYQPRYLSDSGRLFFNSADALVPQDTNGKEDVYEYEPDGVGSCGDSGGCIGLISSGTSGRESAFLDASQNGDDVFFLTAAQLVAPDTDQSIDIYDARVCSESSPCLKYTTPSSSSCESAEGCRPGSVPSQSTAAPRQRHLHRSWQHRSAGRPGKQSQRNRETEAADARAEARQGAEDVPRAAQARKEGAPALRSQSSEELRPAQGQEAQ